jgi:hypothetical protein
MWLPVSDAHDPDKLSAVVASTVKWRCALAVEEHATTTSTSV